MARAAVETAACDLFARAADAPLATALGGTRPAVPAGVAVGLQDTIDDVVDTVGGYLEAGYRRVKLKIGPGHDREPLAALRERYPDAALAADANGAYPAADLDHVRSLDEFGLVFLEQPFPPGDLLAHSDLVATSTTPVCLDESIADADGLGVALRLQAIGMVNVKPGRVGGHGEARRLHDLAVEHGVPAWVGGLLETGIGRAHLVALASLPGFDLPGDISASDRYWDRDVVEPAWVLTDGHLRVPSGPGIGVQVDVSYLDRITMRSTTIR
jgi:O-succinylbenzoate synthase